MVDFFKKFRNTEALSRNEMKNINGQGYSIYTPTGEVLYGAQGEVVGCACDVSYQRTFLGMNYGSPQIQTPPPGQSYICPSSLC